MSRDLDVLSAFTILVIALMFAFSVAFHISNSTICFLGDVEEQSIAVRIIEQLCLSPGDPPNWEDSGAIAIGLAQQFKSTPYTLSKRKVIALSRMSINEVLSYLGVSSSRFKVQISLESLLNDFDELEFKIGFVNSENAFTTSRVVSIGGELFILRVSVERVYGG